MNLYYEGSTGEIIDFNSDALAAENPEVLAKSEWKFSTISGVNGIGRVKTFYKDTSECDFKIDVLAENATEYNAIMAKMHRVFDADVQRMQPGRLWWNGFYREAFIVVQSYESFDEMMESVTKTVHVISTYPFWIKESTYHFTSIRDESTGLDFSFDFPFDLGAPSYSEVLPCDCINSANFKLTFFGPCTDPSVTIGENRYGLFCTLGADERVEIDSKMKTIEKYDAHGNDENYFYLRDKDSYIFTKIDRGDIPVVRSKSLKMDVTLFDERGEPAVWI